MVIKNINLETVCGITSTLPENDKPEVAFAGKSNVGKSSLINALMNRKSYARISATPGKTQTINFYNINDEMYLVDLPGYGYAKISGSEKQRFASLMEEYFGSPRNIPMAIQLIDMRHPPSRDDINMLNLYLELNIRFIIVLTKSDKLKPMARKARLEGIENELGFLTEDVIKIPFSSVTGEGVEQVKEEILKSCGL